MTRTLGRRPAPVPEARTGGAGTRTVRVERAREGGACVLRVDGEIDVTTAPVLADGLARALDSGAARVYVNLDGVTFCDTAGLVALDDARCEARRRDVRLVLVDPSAPVRRMLELTDPHGAFARSETRTSVV
jgi:anti-sigma B factor antagonist